MLPASLAKEPKGPPGDAPKRKVPWSVEDITVLLKGIEEYGSAHLAALARPVQTVHCSARSGIVRSCYGSRCSSGS
jgi:hypothetical protein